MNILNSMILPDNCCQNTINFPVSFSGVGIHSGKVVTIKLLPANHDTGIIFKRTDLSINNKIKVDIENISSSRFCSKLENSQKVSVSTVEHLLASLHSLSIDNVLIEINTSELPAMDGSAYEFTSKLLEAGIKTQKKSKKVLRILKNIKVEINNRSIEVKPSDYLKFNLKINYPNCLIGNDEYTYIHNKSNFINDICLEILPCFEKKLNLFNTKKSFNKNDYKKSKFQNFDKEYLKEILKEFSQKIRNIRNEPSEIDSYNDYFYEVLTSPSKSDSMKYKKSSYFQELVRKYFENE